MTSGQAARSRQPRRVLMTADAVGGVWQYCMELAAGFCADGTEVWLAVMGPAPRPDQLQAAAQIEGLRILHGDFRLEWMEDAEADLPRAGDWLLALASDLQPDLVHLNSYSHAALPWRRPVIVVAHSCVLSWWRAVHGCDAPPAWHRYRDLMTRGLNAADLVIAPTLAFLGTLKSIYSFSTPSCAIWNGRGNLIASNVDKRNVVMTAGRLWDAAKNVSTLTLAAARLEHPVWLAGVEAEESPADGLVHLGRLDESEMRRRLAEALIFALPARYEPFGLTALEAAQCRCALVLGDIATQRELWDGAALFVSPDDAGALARQLKRLLEEPQMAQALGALAHRRARRFTARRMLSRYRRAYAAVTKVKPRHRIVTVPAMPAASLHCH
jgi:glycogen(starch) synthase